ncbi:MAG: hydroxyethylthiazole kinase [Treponema sp.]|nr:hydroxyethylthiazole kinase [Treponema sp.]
MFKTCLDNVRSNCPLIHNITNYVTVNDVANALLAIGASPIMADEPSEAAEITRLCGGLNVNIGTLNKQTIKAMFASAKMAKLLGHPMLLDPVGAGASSLRTKTALDLLGKYRFDIVRGNISEIKTLALGSGTTKGVDADIADSVTEGNLEKSVAFAKDFAARNNCVVAITGAIDLVADDGKCYVIRNGRAEMSRITGTGCQLSAVTAAFAVANPDNLLEATAAAVCAMGLAGEIAHSRMLEGEGNSTYRNRIIDALCNLKGDELEKGAKYEIK